MKRIALQKRRAAPELEESDSGAARSFDSPETKEMAGEAKPNSSTQGILNVVATPIGNLDDISLRALRVLREADLIVAEDARIARALLEFHGIPAPEIVSLRPRRAAAAKTALQAALLAGRSAALICDAGTPGIADPGQELIRAALAANAAVTAVPGPCAALVALSVSGLSAGRFAFDGFPPRARADRIAFFRALANEERAVILYESARYLRATLTELRRVCGADRAAVLVCDATKASETIRRGTLSDLLTCRESGALRGEMTILIAGIAQKTDN